MRQPHRERGEAMRELLEPRHQPTAARPSAPKTAPHGTGCEAASARRDGRDARPSRAAARATERVGHAARDERGLPEAHGAARCTRARWPTIVAGQQRLLAVGVDAQREIARVLPSQRSSLGSSSRCHDSLASSATAAATAFRPRTIHVATVPSGTSEPRRDLLVFEPLEVKDRQRHPLPAQEPLDRRADRLVAARFGHALERVVGRVGQSLDERGDHLPFLGRPRPSASRARARFRARSASSATWRAIPTTQGRGASPSVSRSCPSMARRSVSFVPSSTSGWSSGSRTMLAMTARTSGRSEAASSAKAASFRWPSTARNETDGGRALRASDVAE